MYRLKLTIVALLCVACDSKSGINLDEASMLYYQQDTVMHIYTTSDSAELAFLQQPARPLITSDFNTVPYLILKKQLCRIINDTLHPCLSIAAPQVGVGCRLIAIKRIDKEGGPIEFYPNPEIVWQSDQVHNLPERCSSVPEMSAVLARHDTVIVKYTEEHRLTEKFDTVTGIPAAMFQHNIDHLDGILYISYLTDKPFAL